MGTGSQGLTLFNLTKKISAKPPVEITTNDKRGVPFPRKNFDNKNNYEILPLPESDSEQLISKTS